MLLLTVDQNARHLLILPPSFEYLFWLKTPSLHCTIVLRQISLVFERSDHKNKIADLLSSSVHYINAAAM
jgi:hypothetical protein